MNTLLNTEDTYISHQPFEYLSQYATFDSVSAMDLSVESHIETHHYVLTKSERAIIFFVASRSLAYPGASHLKAGTIANHLGMSTKTVYRSTKKLVELGIIKKLAQSKLNGIKGANIYIILPFDKNVSLEMSEREIADKACKDATNQSENENQSFSFNLLSSKHASNIISIGEKLTLQAQKKKEYMNEWQIMLFDLIHSYGIQDDLKDQLHKAILASKIANQHEYIRAKDVLWNILRDIASGVLTITSTLRAVFVGAHNKSIERASSRINMPPIVKYKPRRVKPVPFYNWIEERE